jgi:hypothetical protein
MQIRTNYYIRIRIREAQKHTGHTDPEHCLDKSLVVVGKASLPPGWKMRLVEEKSGVAGSQRVRRTEFMSPAGDVLGSRRGALEYMVRTGCSQVSSGPGHIVICHFGFLNPDSSFL